MTGTDSPAPDMPARAVPAPAELSAALVSTDPVAAELARDDRTTIYAHDIAVPFQHYVLYLVVNYNPYNPQSLYVAYAPGAPAIVLTRHPEHFAELAAADGLTIESSDVAVAWARAYLETTRTTDEIFYVVSGIDDVLTLQDVPPDEGQQIKAFRSEYAEKITLPRVEGDGPPFVVSTWAIREQALERHRLRVARDGEVTDDISVVARDLPLVYSG